MADPGRKGDPARTVERTYLVLTLLTTLASSFIWGINTIFLLDAGLSNAEAFAANAFFTVGQVIFEVPTGVVADTRGRRLLVRARRRDAAPGDPPVPRHVAGPRAAVGLGDRLDPARPGVHVLLRRDRGVARRRPQGDRLHRPPRARLRPGPGRRRRGDARRDRVGRAHRPGDEPRRARTSSGPRCSGSRCSWRIRFMHDLGFTPQRDIGPVAAVRNVITGLDRRRLPQPAGALADARRAVHLRHRHLRLLRRPALPARSCTATRPRTASPAWPPRSSPGSRSSAASSCPGCAASSDGGPSALLVGGMLNVGPARRCSG